jgi:hypothetical protein
MHKFLTLLLPVALVLPVTAAENPWFTLSGHRRGWAAEGLAATGHSVSGRR